MDKPEDKVRNWRDEIDAQQLAHDEVAFRKWREQRKLTEGGPAFPVYEFSGMTIRDYFAAAALAAMITSWKDIMPIKYETAAAGAFHYADAMLKRRNHERV